MIKVRFNLDSSDWHGHSSETLWAEPVIVNQRSIFRIMNSPFFTLGISYLDIVKTMPTENDTIFDFTNVSIRGGHSTYMILTDLGPMEPNPYWKALERFGCSYESMHIKLSIGEKILYSLDVPKPTDLFEAYEIFKRGQEDGLWILQEGYAHMPPPR